MNVGKKRGRSHSARPVKRFKKRAAVPAVLHQRGPEKRAVDTAGNTDADSTGVFTLLNGIIPGDGLQNRQGRKIQMNSLAIRGRVILFKPGTTPIPDYVRVILLYDRQTNAAAPPSLASILSSVDNAGTPTSNSFSGINLGNADRYKIIRDWYWALGKVNAAATTQGDELVGDFGSKDLSFKDYINMRDYGTQYNAGTAGTVADITSGSLYLFTCGLSANADSQFGVRFQARLRYTDL